MPLIFCILLSLFAFAEEPVRIKQKPFSVSHIAKKAMPSIVMIHAIKETELYNGFASNDGREKTFGTGFFVSNDGYIMTTYHTMKDASKIEIATHTGKTYEAKIAGSDKSLDIALLKIESNDTFDEVTFDEYYEIGDGVVAIGNPFGIGISASFGIVSATSNGGKSATKGFIQTDAAINKGSSGGPLLNMDGYVIGMINSVFSPTGVNVGTNFAIPVNSFFSQIEKLKGEDAHHEEKQEKGSLGIAVRNLDDAALDNLRTIMKSPHGVLITRVIKGGSIDLANIPEGSIITDIVDSKIENTDDIQNITETLIAGSTMQMSVIINGKQYVKTIKIIAAR